MKISLNILSNIARKYYTALPYHNFEHALHVKNRAQELIDRCRRYNVPINDEVVLIAALFHGAGYQDVKDHKEEHSCEIIAVELKKLDYPADIIKAVQECIMATQKDYPLINNEQKIIRAADLSGFTNNYDDFLASSKKIVAEYKILYGQAEFPWKAWTELVESYLVPEIRLTPEYEHDNWHAKARANINRLLKEMKK